MKTSVVFSDEIAPSFNAQLQRLPSCDWVALKADQSEVPSNYPAISDSQDEDIAKDAFVDGVVEADDENGTKGDQDDRVHIYLFVVFISLSFEIISMLKL